ncbi:hypothetical protein [Amycolatopsis sp. NPDC051903]
MAVLDLAGFLREHDTEVLKIRRPVPLDHVGALVGEATSTTIPRPGRTTR